MLFLGKRAGDQRNWFCIGRWRGCLKKCRAWQVYSGDGDRVLSGRTRVSDVEMSGCDLLSNGTHAKGRNRRVGSRFWRWGSHCSNNWWWSKWRADDSSCKCWSRDNRPGRNASSVSEWLFDRTVPFSPKASLRSRLMESRTIGQSNPVQPLQEHLLWYHRILVCILQRLFQSDHLRQMDYCHVQRYLHSLASCNYWIVW